MNIFQRILLKNFLLDLARTIAVLGVVIAGLAFPDIMTHWPGTGAPLLDAAAYVSVQLLVVLDKILPMALLVATLSTVGPLARYQELTALSSAGWSCAVCRHADDHVEPGTALIKHADDWH